MIHRKWIGAGAISALLSVAIGAFGAHALDLGERASTYDTGVQYHMLHAVALLAVGLIGDKLGRGSALSWAGWLFVAGTVLFAGSLYALSITGITRLGAITPLGGVCFLAGWAVMAWCAFRK